MSLSSLDQNRDGRMMFTLIKIKRIVKYLLALMFHFSGYNYYCISKLRAHYILMFHRLDDEDDVLSISIPLSYLSNIAIWGKGLGEIVNMTDLLNQKDKKVRVCITFDDGFKNIKRITEIKSRIPSTLYLSTAYVESEKKFWVSELEELIFGCEKNFLDLTSFNLDVYDLDTIQKKRIAIKLLNSKIKNLHPASIEAVVQYLRLILPKHTGDDQKFLSWKEIQYLISEGMEVGGHTHNHVISSKVTADEFREEIVISNNLITNNTAKPPKHFAYPNGRLQDISVFSRDILKSQGYISAVTTIEGPNSIEDDPYMLKRFNVSKDRIENPWGRPSKAMFTTMLVNPINVH